MSNPPVASVVILGGGTAGWMTAASLAHRLGALGVKVTLIESSQIGTVGVGEATVPAIRNFVASLGLDMFEVMRASRATFKLGIEFAGWRHEGHSFFHPFGPYGIAAGPLQFHNLWLKLRQAGEDQPISDYSLGTQLAWQGRFREADARPQVDFQDFDWALHFDAGLFARFLRIFAEARGVTRIDARLTEVRQDPESGDITALTLDNGTEVTGELFIDCSGFRGLLIQEAMQAGFTDWSQWLICDRAIALPCGNPDGRDLTPYTLSKAQGAGWTWRIPLQHRIGNGYVYSSQHISDDDAEAALRTGLSGAALAEPNRQRFVAGHATKLWAGNCVAIGLASGFLEPLESTSISLIQVAIDKLILLWPTRAIDPRLTDEFNRVSVAEYERIRDFIILHYALNQRHGEPFWDYCREMALPDTLTRKIEAFRARGHFVRYNHESFFDPSWFAMYEGFDVVAQTNTIFAEGIDAAELKDVAAQVRADIRAMAEEAPSHYDALKSRGALA